MHCSTAQGKMSSPVFSAALQNRLTACTLSLCLHLCRFALYTGMQRASTNALQRCSGQNELPKTGSQLACFTAITPMENCSSFRGAVSRLECTAALVWAECMPHCSLLLCKTGSQLACFTAITPMEICSSFRGAVGQLNCTAAQAWAECMPHCSLLLCKTGSQQACATAITPMEVCSFLAQ